MRFVHAADLHLDSPLSGLERFENAPRDEIRMATRHALENLVRLCRDQDAELLLIAGDLYDGDWNDYQTGLFFVAQMARLKEAGVQVVVLRGNHDAASRITRSLRLPDNVRELSFDQPETIVFEDWGVAVHGQSYAQRDVKDNLALRYPAPVRGAFNIGMLHTALSGRAGHQPYAPCTVEDLLSREYDYWALGHVHQREVVSQEPWIIFPGNLQGRHARELGPKGCTLVSLEDGRVRSVEEQVLDVVRWSCCTVPVADLKTPDEVLDQAEKALERELTRAGDHGAEGGTIPYSTRLAAVRLEFEGTSAAHDAWVADAERWDHNLRAVALEIGAGRLFLERISWRGASPLSLTTALERDDAAGVLLRSLRALEHDQDALLEILDDFGELDRKLPAALRQGIEPLDFSDPDTLRRLLPSVERELLPRLWAEETKE